MSALSAEAHAVIEGRHADPFRYLGPHEEGDATIVRVFLPQAEGAAIVDEQGRECGLERIHEAGLFEGRTADATRRYRVRARYPGGEVELEDAYRFPPILSDLDLHLLGEGTHLHLYEKLGAHPMVLDEVAGVAFAVFAPNARRVSVVGDFNGWDGRRHAMRVRGNGLWEIFVPEAKPAHHYKYEIVGPDGRMLPLKADPLAFAAELRPNTASIVVDIDSVARPQPAPAHINALDAPISIYEVHAGSWLRYSDGRPLGWSELAERLVDYVDRMGFTHVEFLPVMAHPFGGSWGYQPLSQFAPNALLGTPEEFALLIDRCHNAGIGVLLDWVPAHFPTDSHGLARFDGTAL